MGILSGNPKDEPMHYGEIFSVWSYSSMAKFGLSCLEAYNNHAGDKDLKSLIKDMINQTNEEIKECDKTLTANGIAPSPSLPARPDTRLEDIPAGARFADQEIAFAIAADNVAGMVMCSQIMGTSIREDIGALFTKYHGVKAANGLRILRLNKEKGWLVPPPLQIQRPEVVTT